MKSRAYWAASVLFAIIAIGVHVKALDEATKGMKAFARSITATDEQKAILKAEAKQHENCSLGVALTGFCAAVASTFYLVVSFKRQEPAWRSIPIGLLVFYVLLQFTLL
jgi:hypothetical protein